MVTNEKQAHHEIINIKSCSPTNRMSLQLQLEICHKKAWAKPKVD
jgi:hypothetical protein